MSRLHWVALATAAGVGGRTITRLLQHFGSLEEVLAAPPAALRGVPGVGPQTAAAIAAIDLPAVEAQLAGWEAGGVGVVTWEDAGYPRALLRTPDAPPVLFHRGELLPEDDRAVAIVGTRQPSRRGEALARQMASELARHGWVIVSGLAIGIDTAAHRGALEAGGRTLAVLGSGVENVYPRRAVSLAAQVATSGAVLSELQPGAGVSRQTLIARNRITSGLCRAVIVVQSQADSGSVNTARWAWKQGRAVFAVAGNEALLAQGAEPIPAGGIDWDDLAARLAGVEIRPPVIEEEAVQSRLF